MTAPTWTCADWQAHFDERAGILEYDQGMARADAEAQAQAVREIYDRRMQTFPPAILGALLQANRKRRDPLLASFLETQDLDRAKLTWGFDDIVREGRIHRLPSIGEKGVAAFIVPAAEDGVLVDLVAEEIATGVMTTRLDAASVVGADHIMHARNTRAPLYVFGTIRQWLKGGGIGSVVIDWQRAGYALDGVTAILCSPSIADRLYSVTRQCVPPPMIATPTASEARHAA